MDFDFSSDQYMLRDSVRSFLNDRWGPKRVRVAGGHFDETLWKGLCELGLQALLVPEAAGGAGMQVVDLVLVLEEFGRALVPAAMAETILSSEVISRFGCGDGAGELLAAILDGRARVAFAHAEAGRGCGIDEVAVRARKSPDGWRLTGRKVLVPCAEPATHFLVSAVHDGGPALFLCVRSDSAVAVKVHDAVDPFSLLGMVDLDNAQAIPVGDASDTQPLERLLETSTLAAAAQMVGISAAALDLAVEYAKQRVQFGKPIGSFQAIKHKCADMLVALESARSAAYYAAWALTDDDGPRELAVSMAKAACSDASRLICAEALQVHGGVGFTWEYDIHLYLRRSKLLEYTWGDASYHRERVAVQVLDSIAAPAATTATRVPAVAGEVA